MKSVMKRLVAAIAAAVILCTLAEVPLMKTVGAKAATGVAKAAISSVRLNANNKPVIRWKKVPQAAGYRLYRKVGSGKWTRVTTTTKTVFKDRKLAAKKGSQVSYKVRAYRKKGGKKVWGAYSKVLTVTLPISSRCMYADAYGICKDAPCRENYYFYDCEVGDRSYVELPSDEGLLAEQYFEDGKLDYRSVRLASALFDDESFYECSWMSKNGIMHMSNIVDKDGNKVDTPEAWAEFENGDPSDYSGFYFRGDVCSITICDRSEYYSGDLLDPHEYREISDGIFSDGYGRYVFEIAINDRVNGREAATGYIWADVLSARSYIEEKVLLNKYEIPEDDALKAMLAEIAPQYAGTVGTKLIPEKYKGQSTSGKKCDCYHFSNWDDVPRGLK